MLKRGQVTIFIILGIILLVVVSLLFVFRDRIFRAKLDLALPTAEKVPLEFEPLREFTHACLKTVGERGLRRLGQQGGYIYPEQTARAQFNDLDQTNADGVTFAGSDTQLPYWWYNSRQNDANNVQLSSKRPSLEIMADDLRQYVVREMGSCLGGYSSFDNLGFLVTESSDAAVEVAIIKGAVRISFTHRIDVVKGAAEASMQRFFTEIPVNLYHLFEIANNITDAQRDYSFLEKNTLSLITLFSDTEPGKLMPMTDSTFQSVGTAVWSKNQLKQDVTLMLSNYVPLIRFADSSNYYSYLFPRSEFSDVRQRIYQDMVLPLGGADGVDVRFNYLDLWPPYFDMNCEGDVCRPQSVSRAMFGYPFGMQRYKAVYDISYPVLVSLNDPSAFGGQGYLFNFALEANIRNNRPALNGELPAAVSLFKDSLLCDENQRTSGDIEIDVRNSFTSEAVAGAQVVYILGDEQCTIGVTDEDGRLTSKFPSALGGTIHAVAPEFAGKFADLDTSAGAADKVSLDLAPYRAITLSIQKKNLVKCNGQCFTPGFEKNPLKAPAANGWVFYNVPFALKENERALVMFHRVNSGEDAVDFAASVVGRETQQIHLPSGDYEVTMNLFSDGEYVIPEARRCEETKGGLFSSGSKNCYTIPELRMPQLITGGLKWNGTRLLRLEPGSYYGSNSLTMVALGIGLVDIPQDQRVIEDTEQMGKYEQYSLTYADELEPRYG